MSLVQSSEASYHSLDTFISPLQYVYYSAGMRSGFDRAQIACGQNVVGHKRVGQCVGGMVLNAQPHPITFYHF